MEINLNNKNHFQKFSAAAVPGLTWEVMLAMALFVLPLVLLDILLYLVATNSNKINYTVFITTATLLFALFLWPKLFIRYRNKQNTLHKSSYHSAITEKKYILYLRDFQTDASIANAIIFKSIEQEIADALIDIGPVIALKNPSEDIKNPGAFRIESKNELWQENIYRLMTDSTLILIRIGKSNGLTWEITKALTSINLKKIVFLLPPDLNKNESIYLLEQIKKITPGIKLSSEIEKAIQKKFDSGIFYFNNSNLLCFSPIGLEIFRQAIWNQFGPSLKISLKYVYENIGIKYTQPPIILTQAFLISLLAIQIPAVLVYLYYVFKNGLPII